MISVELMQLALAWLIYFLLHSLLASLRIKQLVASRKPALMPYYRLVFNGVAIGLLAVPVYLTSLVPGDPLWAWTGAWKWLSYGLSICAMLAFGYSMRFYDGAEFFGLRQLRERETRVEDQERFRVSPLHRYVRHPWYSIALLLIWVQDMPPGFLLTSVLATLYFLFGSRLEERKLVVYYGDVYREYQRLVPPVIPLPWRHLSPAQARHLEQQGNLGKGLRESC